MLRQEKRDCGLSKLILLFVQFGMKYHRALMHPVVRHLCCRTWYVFVLLLMPFSCASSSGNLRSSWPGSAESAPLAKALPSRDPCELAAELRKEVKRFLDEGRLDRTVKLIEKADRLCSRSAPETWAVLVTTLVELGKYAEARKVAAQIEVDEHASAEAKAAASEAKERCDKLDKVFPNTDEAKKEMRRLYLEAMAAEEKFDPESQKRAMDRYLAAWEAWRPNGQALLSAGFVAKKMGQSAEAQRLFDRAIVDAEKAQGTEVKLDVPVGLTGWVRAVAWSRDGRRFAVALASHISIFDMTWHERFACVAMVGSVDSIAFAPNGKSLVAGYSDGTLRLWDMASGQEMRTLQGHRGRALSVAYAPDGKTFASGSDDGTIRQWDAATGTPIRTLRGAVHALAYSPDGTTMASNYGERVAIWDAATGTLIRTLTGHFGDVLSLAYSPDGKTLASGAHENAVRIWDVATGKQIKGLTGSQYFIYALAYSPDGKMLTSGSKAHGTVWDIATGKPFTELRGHAGSFMSMAYSPDGTTLASASDDNTVKLWDMISGSEVRTLMRHARTISSVAYSPDSKTLAVGFSDNVVMLWDLQTGTRLQILKRYARRKSVSPLNKAPWPNHVDRYRQWKGGQGALSVAYSPDSMMLATGYADGSVQLWDVATGGAIRTLHQHAGSVNAVAYSPDGKSLATGSSDKTVKLWNVATGIEGRTLAGYPDAVVSVAYSHDGKTLLSAYSHKRLIKRWDLATMSEMPSWESRLSPLAGHSNASLGGTNAPFSIIYDDRKDTIRVRDAEDGVDLLEMRAIVDEDAAYAVTPSGYIDILGPDACAARQYPVCRIGTLVFPFDVCEERFLVPGLVAKIHTGDTSYIRPDYAPTRMVCPDNPAR